VGLLAALTSWATALGVPDAALKSAALRHRCAQGSSGEAAAGRRRRGWGSESEKGRAKESSEIGNSDTATWRGGGSQQAAGRKISPPPELPKNTGCEFQRTVRGMASFLCTQKIGESVQSPSSEGTLHRYLPFRERGGGG